MKTAREQLLAQVNLPFGQTYQLIRRMDGTQTVRTWREPDIGIDLSFEVADPAPFRGIERHVNAAPVRCGYDEASGIILRVGSRHLLIERVEAGQEVGRYVRINLALTFSRWPYGDRYPAVDLDSLIGLDAMFWP